MDLGDTWPLVVIGGFIALGIAMAYGLMQNARRDKRKDAVTEAATRDLYDKSRSGEPARDNSPEDRLDSVKAGERVPDYGHSPRT